MALKEKKNVIKLNNRVFIPGYMDLPESQNAISGQNRDYFALVADKKTAASPDAKLAGGGERRASAVSSVRFPVN